MTQQKLVSAFSKGYIVMSALSLLYVSIMAFFSPQAVMSLVDVTLTNNDAFSSIRGVYGGVGLTIVISLIYLLVKDRQKALIFLAILWGLYAFSRVITIMKEGALGAFGSQWLKIESIFCLLALTLLFFSTKTVPKNA